MMRTLNLVFVIVTGLVCLGLYRIAEEARVAHADLVVTEKAIATEHDTLTVLGAEWASLTQPARIQALAQRHLDLSDNPTVELSSLTLLPRKGSPLTPGGTPLRTAKAIAPATPPGHTSNVKQVALRTGA